MRNDYLSVLLRQKRLEKGLSLSQLARLADTSAATLSRYENGWQRFEVYTLRKIATALGFRLKIQLEPISEKETNTDKNDFIKTTGRLFWDKPLTQEDIDNYPKWVVKRVLELGTMEDVRKLISLLGKEQFLSTVAGLKFSSSKTDMFWHNILEKENIPCTKRSSRKTASHSWPN